ncbi:MAG: hypothetical protein IJ068_01085 [Bacilli bacterium]|nr:hypothetical protein [Bacilli bacterium]
MKYFRKNKYTIFALVILIILVFVGIKFKNIFVPDEGKASYGTRLSGIENHKIDDADLKEIGTKLKEDEKVLDFEYKIHGKIINLIITVSDDMSVEDAKAKANSTISLFTNGELSFYSLQVYVKKNDSKLNNFPIVGYKGTDAKELVFSKDREITENTEGE